MKKILIAFFLISFHIGFSQKYYDSSNFDYYIDYNTRAVKLKFKDFHIEGKYEKIKDKLYNEYLAVKGSQSSHWIVELWGKSSLSGLEILEGNYADAVEEFKNGREYKKVKVLFSNLPSFSKMKDFNFISETERERKQKELMTKEKFIKELPNSGLEGVYKIKILKHGAIDYKNLNGTGQIYITSAGVTIKTDIPSISLIRGTYMFEKSNLSESDLTCSMSKGYGDAFTLTMNKEGNVGAFSILSSLGVKTTTFLIIE